MKKVRILMSVLMVSLFFVACKSEKDEPTPKLNFDPEAVEVAVGAEVTAKVSGGTAPYAVQVTEEGKELIKATIEGGDITVEGLKEGETTITVTDKDGVKGTLAVKVIDTALKFDPEAAELEVEGEIVVKVSGGTAPYTIAIAEEGEALINATIEESDITIEGLKEGETTITVTDEAGTEGEISVKVTAKEEGGE